MNPQSEEENVEETESRASVAVSNAGSQAASAAGSSASVAQAEEKPAAKKKEKLIRNQFNYQDRGTQSAVQPPRGKAMQTDPPARIELSNQVSQDVIYDFYEKHMKALQAEKEKANTKQKGNEKENKNAKVANVEDKTELGSFTAKVVERMLNQNTYDQLADDFKYFDDPADGPDNAKGSLLPLWRFEYEKAKRLAVTSMVWCPQTQNDDLMVVAFGSYEFGKQSKGYLIFYR
jgi:dynein intermediate chain 1